MIYLFKEGLTRFATEPYEKPSSKRNTENNMFVHLTNYSINKFNDAFECADESDDTGHKRSFTSVIKLL